MRKIVVMFFILVFAVSFLNVVNAKEKVLKGHKLGSSYRVGYVDLGGDDGAIFFFEVTFNDGGEDFFSYDHDDMDKKLNIYQGENLMEPKITIDGLVCREITKGAGKKLECSTGMIGYFDGKKGLNSDWSGAQGQLEFVYETSQEKHIFSTVYVDMDNIEHFPSWICENNPDAEFCKSSDEDDDSGDNEPGEDDAGTSQASQGTSPSICGQDPSASGCDPDGDRIFGRLDKCPLDAEVYQENGNTPVDGLKDGCPNSRFSSASAEPTVGTKSSGACSMVETSRFYPYVFLLVAATLLIFSILRSVFRMRGGSVRIRRDDRHIDLK